MNSMGFYGVLIGLKYQNDALMIQQLDYENLEGLETVTIKIPLTLPYANSKDEFERIDGKYEHHGEYFRLVKQKLFRDTLTIVCVKDQHEKIIEGAMKNYVKTFSQHHSTTQSNKFNNSLIKDYLFQSFGLINSASGWENKISILVPQLKEPSPFLAVPVHPPQIG
jgi:hypothetical protein